MRMINKALFAATAATLFVASQAHAFIWTDTSISERYGWQFKEPGIADSAHPHGVDINKNILAFTHADGYEYGSNFFNIDVLLSGSRDPANNSNVGAVEYYGVYRHVLSGNAVTGSKMFAVGPFADIGLEAGFDINSKNTAFASGKKFIVVGPQFAIDVPAGFFNVSLHYSHEWNNNGIAQKNVNFDAAYEIETAWSFPFDVAGVPVYFKGFANLVGPKGKDGFGGDTKLEILAHPKLMVDVGQLLGAKKKTFEAGVGFEYWLNKFGNDHTKVPGSLAYTPFFEVMYRF